jgi:hypothetical protein
MPPIIDWQFLLRVSPKPASADAADSVWAIDVPTWITGIGTAILATFAIVTAVYAIRAFRAQAQEVRDQAAMLNVQSDQLAEQRRINEKQTGVLELQANELRESLAEREREAEQRHRAQAALVFIIETVRPADPLILSRNSLTVALQARTVLVRNTSNQPIYNVELVWCHEPVGHGEPNLEPLGTLTPNDETRITREFPPDTDMDVSEAVLRFTDAAGVRWLRCPDGYLNEISG